MQFHYSKFFILLQTGIFLGLVACVIAWEDGAFRFDLDLLWVMLVLVPVVVYFHHGKYLFDRIKVDAGSLVVSRPFRADLTIDFEDIKTVRLLKEDSSLDRLRGALEFRYRPAGKYVVHLDHLALRGEFVRLLLEAGVFRTRGNS